MVSESRSGDILQISYPYGTDQQLVYSEKDKWLRAKFSDQKDVFVSPDHYKNTTQMTSQINCFSVTLSLDIESGENTDTNLYILYLKSKM